MHLGFAEGDGLDVGTVDQRRLLRNVFVRGRFPVNRPAEVIDVEGLVLQLLFHLDEQVLHLVHLLALHDVAVAGNVLAQGRVGDEAEDDDGDKHDDRGKGYVEVEGREVEGADLAEALHVADHQLVLFVAAAAEAAEPGLGGVFFHNGVVWGGAARAGAGEFGR